jgi:hypothetical protein
LDSPSDEVARPFLLDVDAPARPAAPWAGAAALHVIAGLALVGIGLGSGPSAPPPPSQVMTVTLVEPPRTEPTSRAAPPLEDEPVAPPEAQPPARITVDVSPPASASPALPDFLRLEDGSAAMGAPSDAVRTALAQSLSCRSAAEGERAECPPGLDGYALAEAAGIGPRVFLDREGLAPYEGFNVAPMGPVAAVFTAEGSCGPGDIQTFRLIFRPRGAALSAADRQAGKLQKTWC